MAKWDKRTFIKKTKSDCLSHVSMITMDLIKFAEDDDVENQFLIDVESANDYYRIDRDWEKMKGRSVAIDFE